MQPKSKYSKDECLFDPLGIYRNFIDSWILLPSSEESLVKPSFMGKLGASSQRNFPNLPILILFGSIPNII